MIAQIEGEVISKNEDFAILKTGGVGYKIYLSDENLSKTRVGKRDFFWTHMVVRENSQDLYGFKEEREMEFFELLLGVSGIGPKSAMAILNLASVKTLERAIAGEDDTYLTKVSGIGKKTAQKILLELKDKLELSEEEGVSLREESDTIEALKALGYSLKEAREALKKVPDEITNPNERIKEALKKLSE